MNVAHLIGDEPFIYTWSDDFIDATPTRFQQLIDIYKKYNGSVLAGIRATKDGDYSRYGFAAGEEVEPGVIDANAIIEKPGKENAPSDLATVSGFLLTPDIFGYLRRAHEQMTEGDELWYNDALKLMLADGKKVYAAEIKDGRYYDAGDKLEYMKTIVDFALRREDIGEQFRDYLKDFLNK
jgi:UTP--glucose-1-phosphate uridylyltransferase